MSSKLYHPRLETGNRLAEIRRFEAEVAEAVRMDKLPIPSEYWRVEYRPNPWGDIIADFYVNGLEIVTRRAPVGTERAAQLLAAGGAS